MKTSLVTEHLVNFYLTPWQMGTYKHTNQNITFISVSNIKNRSILFNVSNTFEIQSVICLGQVTTKWIATALLLFLFNGLLSKKVVSKTLIFLSVPSMHLSIVLNFISDLHDSTMNSVNTHYSFSKGSIVSTSASQLMSILGCFQAYPLSIKCINFYYCSHKFHISIAFTYFKYVIHILG